VSVIPSASDVSGTVIIDGSAPGIELSRRQRFGLTFADGRLVATSGLRTVLHGIFEQAELLAARVDDANWNVFAELSIGLNPAVTEVSGMMVVDTKRRGAVSVAIGDNTTMGGSNHSNVHMDFVTLAPTVLVDDVKIIESGTLLAI
jgi:leucyl aminopeptidase (aminopeptidase T)